MVSSSRQAVACILLLLSSAISAPSQNAVDKGQSSSISGKVTLKGKGISGAVVGLVLRDNRRAESTRMRSVTDDEGNYRLTNVPPGSYEVIVASLLYVTSSRRKPLILGKNETVENIDFTLVRGGVITGKITDAEGRPLVEEEVRISTPTRDQQQSTLTDDRGVYRAFGIPPGRYLVFAGKEEQASFGDPWERGRYTLTYYQDTDDESKAKLIEVSEGSEATGVDIMLGRPLVKYSAYGRVVDGETGEPLPNVRYGVQMFMNPHNSSSRSTGAVSTAKGEFRLENLSPGKYAVFVEPPTDSDWGSEPLPFEVTDHDVEDLIVTTSKGGSVSGQVVLEGVDDKTVRANLARGQLRAQVSTQSQGRRSSPSGKINADGSFSVRGLGAGIVYFWLMNVDQLQVMRVERDGVLYPRGMPIKEQEQISGLKIIVTQANGTIRGVVKIESGSQPPGSQVFVSVRRVTEDAYPSYDSVQVDSRGQFVAVGLLPGTYEVNAALGIVSEGNSRLLMPRASQQVVVTNGAVTNVTITLQSTSNRP